MTEGDATPLEWIQRVVGLKDAEIERLQNVAAAGKRVQGIVITVGSLFAGVGGIELGLERTGGFKTVWQVEIDDYATRVLEKHWPDVRRWRDMRTFPPEPVDEWRCDLICGGFPCQDISYAGKGAGLAGERSGLWYEYARVIRVLRPRYVLIENVSALLVCGLDTVLCNLAALGYDAEWHVIPAATFGTYQIRERVFVLAYTNSHRRAPVITSDRLPCKRVGKSVKEWCGIKPQLKRGVSGRVWAAVDPLFQRMADGFSGSVDRLRCLGNAVVPQVAEWIGERILEAEKIRE